MVHVPCMDDRFVFPCNNHQPRSPIKEPIRYFFFNSKINLYKKTIKKLDGTMKMKIKIKNYYYQ